MHWFVVIAVIGIVWVKWISHSAAAATATAAGTRWTGAARSREALEHPGSNGKARTRSQTNFQIAGIASPKTDGRHARHAEFTGKWSWKVYARGAGSKTGSVESYAGKYLPVVGLGVTYSRCSYPHQSLVTSSPPTLAGLGAGALQVSDLADVERATTRIKDVAKAFA